MKVKNPARGRSGSSDHSRMMRILIMLFKKWKKIKHHTSEYLKQRLKIYLYNI